MARSKRKNMQALSGLLFLVVACLVAVAVVNIKHHDILTGTRLIAWSFVPLTLLLVFLWPTRCRVKTSRSKPCRNDAYGFLFGCNRGGHWWKKFSVRLGFYKEPHEGPRRRSARGDQVVMYQVMPEGQPVRVTVEDTKLGVCGFWIGLAASVATVVQFVTLAIH